MPGVEIKLSYAPPTPQQAAAWVRLWRLLLGSEKNNASSGKEPEEASTQRAVRPALTDGGASYDSTPLA
jgi:hypothetical protein